MNPKPQHPKPAQVLGCWVARAGTHSRKNRRDFPVSNSLHSQAVQVAPTISSQSQARFGTAVPKHFDMGGLCSRRSSRCTVLADAQCPYLKLGSHRRQLQPNLQGLQRAAPYVTRGALLTSCRRTRAEGCASLVQHLRHPMVSYQRLRGQAATTWHYRVSGFGML